MSSLGSGGGSATSSTGGKLQTIQGLGLDRLTQMLQQGQGTPAQQSASLSPQQRLAQILQSYGGAGA